MTRLSNLRGGKREASAKPSLSARGVLLAWVFSGLGLMGQGPSSWISAWTAPPDQAGPAMAPQTIRQVVRASHGGGRVRIRLSNLFGDAPLQIGASRGPYLEQAPPSCRARTALLPSGARLP
jgi:hypothetical protein